MSDFPVSSSILSAPDLADFIQEKYGWSNNVHCHLLKAGISHTYLVSNGNIKYIFRLYSLNWRTKTEISEEIKLLNLLFADNITVSIPIKDVHQNYIQELNAPEGTRYAVLFSFARGEKLFNFSPEQHFKAGQLIARMHLLTNNLALNRVEYNAETLLIHSFEKLKPFLPAESAEMIFMQSAQHYLLKEFSNANSDLVRNGIVHLDIWFDNMHFNGPDEITLFDFDFCGNGWLCLDIAYYLLQIKSTEKEDMIFESKSAQFLKGYESVTPITPEEKRLLPMLGTSLYFFYLGVQCGRFDNWSNTFLNDIYLKRFINLLLKKWCEYNKLPVHQV